jgi:predicted NUDIX family NTP pyrophosphohydrolase
MLRILGQRRAFTGRWRLGQDVLLEFAVEDPKQLVAFTKQTIKATFRCFGPGHGPRSQRLATSQADAIRAVLAFCTATPLDGTPMIRLVNEPEFPPGAAVNDSLPELSVQGVFPWSRMSEAALIGAREFVSRMVNALTAYEHALHQPTGDAATMFFVSAIEALTVPNHGYAHQRVTSRFVKSLLALATPKLEETIQHANFVEAFGPRRTAQRLSERIYALRSTPVHTGQFGLSRDSFLGFSLGASIRAALLAEIAETAVLEFLRCPFTSLIGHMEFDPACRIELTDTERVTVQAAARDRGVSIEDYILQALGLPPRPPRM